jgi:glycosyltransferase involved in cell wall biosynthesis
VKVVQIVTQMEAAGAQKVAHHLHEGLSTKGHDSELWFLYTKRPAYAGLPGVSSILDHRPSVQGYLTIACRLYEKLRQHRPDAVVTHTHYANVMGQTVAAAAGVPKRIAVHHNELSTYPRAARMADCLLGHAGVYSDIVVVSETVRQSTTHYLQRYSGLVHRIHNCVELATQVDTGDVRATWGIPCCKPLLLSVGRLSRQKNHGTLFQALCKVPDAFLVVIGDGELASELRRQVDELSISERVVFTGEVNQEKVNELMSCASLFVFPSLWEGLSMAALEAMSRGMATVASDIPANREVFGDSAVFVPATNVIELAREINRVLGDPFLARELRSKAVARARLFSTESLTYEYEQLLSSH